MKFGIRLITMAVRSKAYLRQLRSRIRHFSQLYSGKSVVTIFGSCRQDSLYESFSVTRIREDLTYTHYIEEAIQAAKYCSDLNFNAELKGAFRVDFLGKPRPNRKALRREFLATDVFVVEVASLFEYEFDNVYLHHEAYDSMAGKGFSDLGLPDVQFINRTRSNLHDTSAKLDRLFEIIPKNKTVLVSHIATTQESDRWKLAQIIREYAFQNNIEFFDPSEILEIWPLEAICRIESVVSHFTPMGHEIVRDRLSQHIFKIITATKKNDSKVIINYRQASDGIGFGDFVFGSIFVKQLAASAELPIDFDLTGHPIGNLLGLQKKVDAASKVITLYHHDPVAKFTGAGTYISNRRPKQINAGDRDFIIRTLFSPYLKTLGSGISKIDFQNKWHVNSTVFHVRLGDDISFKDYEIDEQAKLSFEDTQMKIRKILEYFETTNNYIILSDSKAFREYISTSGLNTSLANVEHFNSQSVDSLESLEDMIMEFILCVNATTIIQFSIYPWGSGFSESAGALGGGKLIRFQIDSTS